jgi:mannosyltransferase OCH1-like enzyme
MLKHRNLAAISIAIGLIGFFSLLLHLHAFPSSRHIPEIISKDFQGNSRPQAPVLSEDLQTYTTFKVPGELHGFPPHIWQTTGPKPITQEQSSDIASWREKHPFFSFTLMTDEQGDSFVSEYYANRSDIVDLFLRLPIPIIKADLFRYLALVAKGGIYADIDVLCVKPISTWLPSEHADAADSISLIVGLEFDFQFRGEGVEVASQFTNWIIASKPGNKHLMHVIDTAVAGIYATAKKHDIDIKHLELWMFPDVVNIAGPKRMTIGILESLSRAMNRLVDDRMISDTKEPRLVGDVLIMPNNAFAALQAGYPTDRGPVLVTHHYAGSWKASGDAAKALKQEKEKMEGSNGE